MQTLQLRMEVAPNAEIFKEHGLFCRGMSGLVFGRGVEDFFEEDGDGFSRD